MLFQRSSQRGYSLIELSVVIAVITVVGLTSIPNIFNRNDRMLLDSSANQLRQIIIDAVTRSQAPDKNDSSGAPQIFQVSLGKFPQAADTNTVTALGAVTTNRISLERGLAQCDSGDLQGGFTTLRNITLPRGIYISSFYPFNYPSDPTAQDDRAVIRFSVGEDGFKCGSYNNPFFESNQLFISGWTGKQIESGATNARYLVVTLGSQKVGDKRYVTIDRFTREVAVTSSNPQSYFTPVVDVLAPKWDDVDGINPKIDPPNFLMSIACGWAESEITIAFPRAEDQVNDPDIVDPNLFVAYNINWKVGTLDQPIATNYFYDLTKDTVKYQFSTDGFSIANQPKKVTITVAAGDGWGQIQPSTGDDSKLKPRTKEFTLSCGSVISNPPKDPPPPIKFEDPGGKNNACNPIIPMSKTRNSFTGRIAQLFSNRALAAPAGCPPENPP